jgi:hypothetical protein
MLLSLSSTYPLFGNQYNIPGDNLNVKQPSLTSCQSGHLGRGLLGQGNTDAVASERARLSRFALPRETVRVMVPDREL